MTERSRWEERTVTDEEALEMTPVLEELVKAPGWAVYLDLLLKAARVAAREAALSHGRDEFDRFAGVVAGLEAASELPLDVIKQAQQAVRQAEKAPAGRRLSLARDPGDPVF